MNWFAYVIIVSGGLAAFALYKGLTVKGDDTPAPPTKKAPYLTHATPSGCRCGRCGWWRSCDGTDHSVWIEEDREARHWEDHKLVPGRKPTWCSTYCDRFLAGFDEPEDCQSTMDEGMTWRQIGW